MSLRPPWMCCPIYLKTRFIGIVAGYVWNYAVSNEVNVAFGRRTPQSSKRTCDVLDARNKSNMKEKLKRCHWNDVRGLVYTFHRWGDSKKIFRSGNWENKKSKTCSGTGKRVNVEVKKEEELRSKGITWIWNSWSAPLSGQACNYRRKLSNYLGKQIFLLFLLSSSLIIISVMNGRSMDPKLSSPQFLQLKTFTLPLIMCVFINVNRIVLAELSRSVHCKFLYSC